MEANNFSLTTYALSLFPFYRCKTTQINRTLDADRSKEFYTFPAMDYELLKKTQRYKRKIEISRKDAQL